ncbi:AGAP009594-PA-like protein [Anopheles sinensis]|uniref:AGAP009594-PA-like protein n=1 Tax=Anopheles sinensis TaxID=74873 RepID=A0A084VBY3_ANOSI|nr:AGAP009594-PA-like protein [Anopheles sinensis]
MQELSNLEAWKETEALFNKHPDGQTSPPPSTSYGQWSGMDGKDKPSPEQSLQNKAVNNKDNTKRSLVEEISNEEYTLLTKRKDSNEKHPDAPAATIENEKESKIATAEKEETLNVVIHSKEISITMQPSCSDGKEIPPNSKDGDECVGERKPSVASVDYVTGSDSNSDPTLVTDCDSCIRNSSVAYSSRSDTSTDSEDMFDKIVPRKHRKLASLVRTDPSSTSSSGSSSESEGETGTLGNKLDRQNTITEFIDEYKRFFRSVDTRDPKCVVKNRHKLVRPQTAKSQRTEPLIYDGVLKSMERQSNASKIEQVRQERAEACASMAKESVFERLLKGHAAVDMDIESPTISIGGKPHNLNEYRLDVFREGPAKLQTLIDRVTAHKDKYNAHIDSIHVQLANIMDDYGQISEKLKKVDDMIQTIEEEVVRDDEDEFKDAVDKIPQQSTVERIVENMTKEQAVEVGTGNDQPLSSGESSGASFDHALFDHDGQGDENEPGSRIEIEEGISVPAPERKSIPDEFHGDPVYRKFIDIQHEIDKLTADEIFHVLSEAARELHGDEEQETRVLHDAVDEYWARYDDVEAFRRCLNLNAHPIIQRFKRFIECQYETDTDSEDREHVRKLEQAYQRYERRLSNHLFDEYLIMSRKVSIATTTGGESSAAELEIIEIEPDAGEVAGVSGVRRSNAWDLKEPGENPSATEVPPVLMMKSDAEETAPKSDELEDEESKPEQEDLFNEETQRTRGEEEHEISS